MCVYKYMCVCIGTSDQIGNVNRVKPPNLVCQRAAHGVFLYVG